MPDAPAAIRWTQRCSGALTGAGAAAAGALVLLKLAPPPGTFSHTLALVLCAAGAAWSLSALLWPAGRIARLIHLASINAMIFAGLLAAVELAGRVTKFDFARLRTKHAEQSRNDYPLWTREPDVPLPEVFFCHPGPFTWTGQPLRTLEVLRLGTDNAYLDEKPFTVSYDANGFRNPPALTDWEAVIVGDSYTELGYLPDEEMMSSIAAARSGLRLKNLGVCDIGLLAYSRYLKNFGTAKSCKQVVFVMFEGNDVQDTEAEHQALLNYQLQGERDFRVLGAQNSFIKAMAAAVKDARHQLSPQSYQNAWFLTRHEPLPITISTELPIAPNAMTGTQLMALKTGIAECARQAREFNLQATLVYVPVNNRVYHGMIRFSDRLPAEVRDWKPNDLPTLVSELCAANGIAFADTTPALRTAAEQGHYVHNKILDCHVNAEGSRIIGEVIANVLTATVKPAQVAATPGGR